MLVGKTRTVRRRVAFILVSVVGVTLAGVGLAGLGAAAELWAWPPQPSSGLGVGCGLVAGAIVLFEMALLPRKWLRGRRLGATRVWMRLHVWLGLACLPVVLVHAGFALGGPLPATTLILVLLVTASGVWGLVLQQWLPQKLLADFPAETVASQIDFLGGSVRAEAERIVAALVSVPPEAETAEPVVTGAPANELVAFAERVFLPYLDGSDRQSPLAGRAEAEQRFARLRDAVPAAAWPALERLHDLADLRRQWDAQARLHAWLHNWLLVHLPLSVLMTGLMLIHAARALKYW